MRNHFRKIFLFFILIVLLAFNFQDNISSGWYFQSLPPLHGAQISDMSFTDSLTGFIVTKKDSFNTAYILKTTDGGDNWNIKNQITGAFTKVQFANNTTGFASCIKLLKTTNAGENWIEVSTLPSNGYIDDISIVNENEIWAASHGAIDGGLYRSTNSGLNWQTIFYNTFGNPDRIYMYSSSLGFMIYRGKLHRTSNSGASWDSVPGQRSFIYQIKMIDNLTGWKVSGDVKKTTDGGLTWTLQNVPFVFGTGAGINISVLNKDTLWLAGDAVYISNNNYRSVVFKTTNSGTSWGYQILDKNINSFVPYFIQFANNNCGWAYTENGNGFRTKVGGNDTTIYTNIKQFSSEIPNSFKLYQNYPNPFNPTTKITYELQTASEVTLKIFDLNAKEVSTLINQKQSPGTYQYTFDASGLSSGIYFYTLQTQNFKETKKMILMK